jgi:hypothetical protein
VRDKLSRGKIKLEINLPESYIGKRSFQGGMILSSGKT